MDTARYLKPRHCQTYYIVSLHWTATHQSVRWCQCMVRTCSIRPSDVQHVSAAVGSSRQPALRCSPAVKRNDPCSSWSGARACAAPRRGGRVEAACTAHRCRGRGHGGVSDTVQPQRAPPALFPTSDPRAPPRAASSLPCGTEVGLAHHPPPSSVNPCWRCTLAVVVRVTAAAASDAVHATPHPAKTGRPPLMHRPCTVEAVRGC